MTDMVRIRIRSEGPESWRLVVEDIETGKILPILWDRPITLRDDQGYLVADVALVIHQADIKLSAVVTEQVELVPPSVADAIAGLPGVIVRRESLDDFAARTVALVMEGPE